MPGIEEARAAGRAEGRPAVAPTSLRPRRILPCSERMEQRGGRTRGLRPLEAEAEKYPESGG